MNKYAAAGLAEEARSGRRVLVITGTQRAARDAFLETAAQADESAKTYRANGRERVVFPSSGEVRFHTVQGRGMRGMSADTVFVDWDAEQILHERTDGWAEILPIIAMGPSGQIVRA